MTMTEDNTMASIGTDLNPFEADDEVADAEIVPMYDRAKAEEVTAELRIGLDNITTKVIDAYAARIWITMGYDSWGDYCEAYDLQFPREYIPELKAAGMSTRSIATVTGVSNATVSRAGGVSESNTVIGVDGVEQKARKARTPKPGAEPPKIDEKKLRAAYPNLDNTEVEYMLTGRLVHFEGEVEDHPTWCSVVNPLAEAGLMKYTDSDHAEYTVPDKVATAEWKKWKKAFDAIHAELKPDWDDLEAEWERIDKEYKEYKERRKDLEKTERDMVAKALSPKVPATNGEGEC